MLNVVDVLEYVRAAGFEVDGSPTTSVPSWLIDYTSTRMDGRMFFCVPLGALDARVRAALDQVDGQNVPDGSPETRAAGLFVAVVLGAASRDDAEFENFELPERLRLGESDLVRVEALYPYALQDVALDVVLGDRLSTNIQRLLVIVDRQRDGADRDVVLG